jgi:hypothetical protein
VGWWWLERLDLWFTPKSPLTHPTHTRKQVTPEKRLGCGPGGIAEIKAHRWFGHINWDALAARQLPAPILPRLTSLLDTSNFDAFDEPDLTTPHGKLGSSGLGGGGSGPTTQQQQQHGNSGGTGSSKGAAVWDTWHWVGGLSKAQLPAGGRDAL